MNLYEANTLAITIASKRTNLRRALAKTERILWTEKLDILIPLCRMKVRRDPSDHTFPRIGEVLALTKISKVSVRC